MNTDNSFHLFLEKYENPLIIVLCIIALVRIFTFSAAFPFFNNVDEHAHFDMVIKYAGGFLPSNQSDNFDQGIRGNYSELWHHRILSSRTRPVP